MGMPLTSSSSSSPPSPPPSSSVWPLTVVAGFGMRSLLFLLLAMASITLLLLLSTDFLMFSSSQLLTISTPSSGSYPGVLIHNQQQESLYNHETDSIINSSNVGTWNLGSPRSAIEKHKEYSNLIKPDVGTLKHGNPSAEINMQAESSSEFDDEGDINKLQEEKGLKERIFQHGITDTYRGSHSLVPKARSCNYYTGKWVKGVNKPLYSGKSCKRWLSGMWACREMNGRPSFEYESYKWKPDGCNLPVFQSHDFLSRMRNKVLVFVGDSIGRQQFQSLMCMLTGGKDDALVEDVGKYYGLVKKKGEIRAEGTAQRFVESNTTIIYYWSATLCELQALNATRKDTEYAMHLDRPATFIQKYLKLIDVLVLNTGHHWNRGKMNANKWVMYVEGKPNTNARLFKDFGFARNFTIHKVATWLHNQRERNKTRAEVYIRSLSPRHFFNGDWDSGGRCDVSLVPVEAKNVSGRNVLDPSVESAVLGTRIHLLNITYISQFRDEAHISKYRPQQSGQDCLHWCLPGVPDVWNELLYAELLSKETGVVKVV